MLARNALFVGLCVLGLALAGRTLFRTEPAGKVPYGKTLGEFDADFQGTVERVNDEFRAAWDVVGVAPVERADDLTTARRLALALAGTVPSLAEIRHFEKQEPARRLSAWTDRLLADRRSSDYLAERYARQFVGVEDGPFLLYRRRRFVSWLADRLHENRPLDATCRQMIASTGLWTDNPATNFITVSLMPDEDNRVDVNKLAGRVSRAMLGIRLDCAQCHDDKFNDRWKQTDFQHLAAFFGETKTQFTGIRDTAPGYYLDQPGMEKKELIVPAVPFAADQLPTSGTARERLAHWITAGGRKYFARAQVNRMWALMCGRPLCDPVDDLPLEAPFPPGLEPLAEEFIRSGYDLQRLIRLIAATEVFALASRAPSIDEEPMTDESDKLAVAREKNWAIFPITRLRPEQVAGGLWQAATLTTINYDAHIFVRIARATGERDFLRSYGDAGQNELEASGETIPQRLLMLNGDLVEDRTRDNLILNAATQIAALAPDDATAVEIAYLTVLTRRPTPEEAEHFAARLNNARNPQRKQILADIYWSLLNSVEFSWNH